MILNLCLSILLPVLTLRVILADNGLQTSDQKDPELSDMKGSLSVVDEAGNPGDSFLSNKRATGFMPMRGRKDYLEEKRMNFMPMRGKKELLSESEDPLAEKRMNFMPMRGRKNGFPELYENYVLNPMDYDEDAMMSKRASGFVPMRGKKEEDKRAGFHALRGKKGGPAELFRTSFGSNRNWDGRAPAFEPKRANAFFGMRGKREARLEPFSSLRYSRK